jgi:hypothetical protein
MSDNFVSETMVKSMPDTINNEVITDGAGISFDSTLHQMGKDGAPKITKAGNFKKKAGKSKIADVTVPDDTMAFQACGSTTAEMIFIAAQGIGGPDWNPKPEERVYMTEAFTQYYQSKEVKDLPPGVIVATALISYGAPRFVMPQTQSRFKKAVSWVKSRIARVKGRTPQEDNSPAMGEPSERDRMSIS